MSVLPNNTLNTSHAQQTIQVLMLAFAGFIFNTTEFIPVGLLSDIAGDFHMTPAAAGWMLTLYAWVVAVISLPLIILTRRIERKRLMIMIFIIFIISHIMCYFAWSFRSLVVSRMGVAIAHAMFWSMTANLAIRLVPPQRKAFALSMIATGTSLAMILGVPLGRIIGEIANWRMAFGSIALIATLILLALIRLLPNVPNAFHGSVKDIAQLFKNPLLILIYIFVFLMFSCHFTTYSYIEPLLRNVGGFSENKITFLLLLFGIAAIIGSLSFAKIARRLPLKVRLVAFTVIQIIAIVLFPSALPVSQFLFLAIIIWGASRIIMVISLQSTMLSINEHGGDFVMAVFSSIVNVGIGGGALIGGQVITHVGMPYIAYCSGLIGLIAMTLLFIIVRHPKFRS